MSDGISYSNLKTLSECPQKYEYSYGRRLIPLEPRFILDAGSAIGKARELWYKGEPWEAGLHEAYPHAPPPGHRQSYMTSDYLETVFRHYIDIYHAEPYEPIENVAEELLTVNLPGLGEPLRLRVDALLRHTASDWLCVDDLKCALMPANADTCEMKYGLQKQRPLYIAAMRELGYDVSRASITMVSIGTAGLTPAGNPSKNFTHRHVRIYSDEELADAIAWAEARRRELRWRQQYKHDNPTPPVSMWPQTDGYPVATLCKWCDFKPVCASDPLTREAELAMSYREKEPS